MSVHAQAYSIAAPGAVPSALSIQSHPPVWHHPSSPTHVADSPRAGGSSVPLNSCQVLPASPRSPAPRSPLWNASSKKPSRVCGPESSRHTWGPNSLVLEFPRNGSCTVPPAAMRQTLPCYPGHVNAVPTVTGGWKQQGSPHLASPGMSVDGGERYVPGRYDSKERLSFSPSPSPPPPASNLAPQSSITNVVEVVRDIVLPDPDSQNMRRLLAEKDAHIETLELRLAGAWHLVESSLASGTREDKTAHLQAILTERDNRIETQNTLVKELRKRIEMQQMEIDRLRQECGRVGNGNETPLREMESHRVPDESPPDLRWLVVADEVSPLSGASEQDLDNIGTPRRSPNSQTVSPRSAPCTPASPSSARASVPRLSMGKLTMDAALQESNSKATSSEMVLQSARTWDASDVIRVGEDTIDLQLRRYFEQRPGFKVFTNKLQEGLYTFGKPINLKVFMKMAAGEVVVRTAGTYKRLELWLDEYRDREAAAIRDGVTSASLSERGSLSERSRSTGPAPRRLHSPRSRGSD